MPMPSLAISAAPASTSASKARVGGACPCTPWITESESQRAVVLHSHSVELVEVWACRMAREWEMGWAQASGLEWVPTRLIT